MICCVCGKEIVINHGSVEMNGAYCDKCIKYVEKQKITDCAYTDEQIISALEIRMPHDAICREALDLIKWQRAEIERLKAMVDAAEEEFSPLPFKNNFDKYIARSRCRWA